MQAPYIRIEDSGIVVKRTVLKSFVCVIASFDEPADVTSAIEKLIRRERAAGPRESCRALHIGHRGDGQLGERLVGCFEKFGREHRHRE